nr:hypothetical protein [Pandoravirus massiliensis]
MKEGKKTKNIFSAYIFFLFSSLCSVCLWLFFLARALATVGAHRPRQHAPQRPQTIIKVCSNGQRETSQRKKYTNRRDDEQAENVGCKRAVARRRDWLVTARHPPFFASGTCDNKGKRRRPTPPMQQQQQPGSRSLPTLCFACPVVFLQIYLREKSRLLLVCGPRTHRPHATDAGGRPKKDDARQTSLARRDRARAKKGAPWDYVDREDSSRAVLHGTNQWVIGSAWTLHVIGWA